MNAANSTTVTAIGNVFQKIDSPNVASRCNHTMALSRYNGRWERRCNGRRSYRSITAITAASGHKVNGSRGAVALYGSYIVRRYYLWRNLWLLLQLLLLFVRHRRFFHFDFRLVDLLRLDLKQEIKLNWSVWFRSSKFSTTSRRNLLDA